jgi:hypothetical protein
MLALASAFNHVVNEISGGETVRVVGMPNVVSSLRERWGQFSITGERSSFRQVGGSKDSSLARRLAGFVQGIF